MTPLLPSTRRAAAAVLAALLLAGARPAAAAPAFTASTTAAEAALGRHALRTLDGAPLSLASLRGQVVVVNFWATWCAPCRRELPRLNALHRDVTPLGARVIAVSIDEDAANVRRWAQAQKLTLPVAHDGPEGLARELDLKAVPATLVLDKDGRVAWSTARSDDATLAELASTVRRLAAGGGVAARAEGGAR